MDRWCTRRRSFWLKHILILEGEIEHSSCSLERTQGGVRCPCYFLFHPKRSEQSWYSWIPTLHIWRGESNRLVFPTSTKKQQTVCVEQQSRSSRLVADTRDPRFSNNAFFLAQVVAQSCVEVRDCSYLGVIVDCGRRKADRITAIELKARIEEVMSRGAEWNGPRPCGSGQSPAAAAVVASAADCVETKHRVKTSILLR